MLDFILDYIVPFYNDVFVGVLIEFWAVISIIVSAILLNNSSKIEKHKIKRKFITIVSFLSVCFCDVGLLATFLSEPERNFRGEFFNYIPMIFTIFMIIGIALTMIATWFSNRKLFMFYIAVYIMILIHNAYDSFYYFPLRYQIFEDCTIHGLGG